MSQSDLVRERAFYYKAAATPQDGGFAYGPADPENNVVPIGPGNSLPLIVLWLFATTDPEYMLTDDPTGAYGFTYEKAATALGLSADYVKFFFQWVNENGRVEMLHQVENLFETLLISAGYVPTGGGGVCVDFDTLLKLAPMACAEWNASENQTAKVSSEETK